MLAEAAVVAVLPLPERADDCEERLLGQIFRERDVPGAAWTEALDARPGVARQFLLRSAVALFHTQSNVTPERVEGHALSASLPQK